MKMKNLQWHPAQNGRQIDIYARDPAEDRTKTIACNVRDDCAALLAAAPSLLHACLEARSAFKRALDLEIGNHGPTSHAEEYNFALGLVEKALRDAGELPPKSEAEKVQEFKDECGIA